MFTWIKDRLSERTSMDGAAIIAVALIVLFLSPFAKIAAYADPKVIVGKILSPENSPHPLTGRISNQIPNIKIKIGPKIIEGTHIPIIETLIGK